MTEDKTKLKPTTEDWLSPMNKLIWIKAFKAKQTQVTVRDGRKFTIQYKKRNNVDIVFIRPVVGSVPMGFFELRKVTEPSWLEENPGGYKP